MTYNPCHAVIADFSLERRAGGRQLVHFTQGRKQHIVRERCTDRVGADDLTLVIDRFGRGDPVHPHGSVIQRFDLGDCAVKPHNEDLVFSVQGQRKMTLTLLKIFSPLLLSVILAAAVDPTSGVSWFLGSAGMAITIRLIVRSGCQSDTSSYTR